MIPRKTWDQWAAGKLKAKAICTKKESLERCIPLRSKKKCVDCNVAETAVREPEELRLPGETRG